MQDVIKPLMVASFAIAGLSIGTTLTHVKVEMQPADSALPVAITWDNPASEASRHLSAHPSAKQAAIKQAAIKQGPIAQIELPAGASTYFGTVAGGGAPSYNEIALEKNVRYFQRSLQALGFAPTLASYFFANGDDGQATVRYLDETGEEQFKPPEIPHLAGAATYANTRGWFQSATRAHLPI